MSSCPLVHPIYAAFFVLVRGVGECAHVFHTHCITRWLAQQQSQASLGHDPYDPAAAAAAATCRMCRQPWRFKHTAHPLRPKRHRQRRRHKRHKRTLRPPAIESLDAEIWRAWATGCIALRISTCFNTPHLGMLIHLKLCIAMCVIRWNAASTIPFVIFIHLAHKMPAPARFCWLLSSPPHSRIPSRPRHKSPLS